MIKCTKRKPLFDVVADYDDVRTIFFKILWGMVFIAGVMAYPWSVLAENNPSNSQVVWAILGLIVIAGGLIWYLYLLLMWESSASKYIPNNYHMPYTCRYKIIDRDVYVATSFCWFKTNFRLDRSDGSGEGTIDDWLDKKIYLNEKAKEDAKNAKENKEGLA